MKKVVVGIIARKNDNGEDEYLLVSSRRDFGEFTGYYYPPGGHVEEGEDEKAALVREIKEELRIEVSPIRKVVETAGDVQDQMTHWWLCEGSANGMRIQSGEIADAGFFTRDQMGTMNIWPATRKFFEEYIFESNV